MRAAGALPSEQRCQDMNDAQWLWYYLNLQKDLEEDRDKYKNYMDYIGSWLNPELAKSVMQLEAQKKAQENNEVPDSGTRIQIDDTSEIVYGDTAVNDGFEAELRRAMAAEGADESQLVSLPDSTQAGDATETKEEFLSRVMEMQELVGTNFGLPVEENILDIVDPLIAPITSTGEALIPINQDDLDFFEDDEE